MEQQVIISIRGDQEFADQEQDTMEFVTEGTLTSTHYGYLLEYDESELTGMAGTHTAFQIRSNSVALIRSGAFRSQMIFEIGKKHYSMYDTPYGSMTMDIVTNSICSSLDERGGELEIRYSIEIEHQLTGESRFQIKVRPANGAAAQ